MKKPHFFRCILCGDPAFQRCAYCHEPVCKRCRTVSQGKVYCTPQHRDHPIIGIRPILRHFEQSFR